jgi:glycerophosphoryl diester phosphodiesterase
MMPLRPAWLSSRPIAHRGLHDSGPARPENSLAAFDAAAQAGYPCELDVQLTHDGTLVVLHDYDLERATGVARPVATLTASDLASTRLFGGDQHVPTLTEVLECVDGRIPLQIELKRPRQTAPRALARAVLETLESHGGKRGQHGQYALSSFDPSTVYALRAARPGLPIGQISGLLRTADPVTRLIGRSMAANYLTHPDFISYELAALPSRVVAMWRRRGVIVLAWTVESPGDEIRARKHADHIIFSGFLPDI